MDSCYVLEMIPRVTMRLNGSLFGINVWNSSEFLSLSLVCWYVRYIYSRYIYNIYKYINIYILYSCFWPLAPPQYISFE